MPQGRPLIAKQFSVSENVAELLIKNHLCLCYDVCHFAIGYEEHQQVIMELEALGIKVGKIQISAALKARLSDNSDQRSSVITSFKSFDEPTYLHQVVAKTAGGALLRYPDLPEAILDSQNADVDEWRAHFHVPIFTQEFGVLQATQNDIVDVLNINKKHSFSQHLEVETYTWGVLPDEKKLPINNSIARELNWVKDLL